VSIHTRPPQPPALRAKSLYRFLLCLLFLAMLPGVGHAQASTQWPEKLARTIVTTWPDSLAEFPGQPVKWNYGQGVVLEGFKGLWERTGNKQYFAYIQKSIDFFVQPDGRINKYRLGNYNIDEVKNGTLLSLPANQAAQIPESRFYTTRAAEGPPAQPRWRLLAQAGVPAPDVARRPLYG
jgi:hypothetical protein